MIKIDIVCPTGGLHGGVENVIKDWVQHLNPKQFDLRIVHITAGISYLNGYEKAYFVYNTLEQPDLQQLTLGYLQFVTEHGVPDLCIATNWPMMTLACHAVKTNYAPNMLIISWVHNKINAYRDAGLGGLEHLQYADAHFCINKQSQKQIEHAFPNAKTFMIGNPVHIPPYYNEQRDSRTLAYVGRLDYVKRIDLILEAIYRSKYSWHLKIIGDGELRETVLSWIELLQLQDQVELIDWQQHPWNSCQDASISVIASEYEGFCLSSFEASAVGMTVISTPVNGVTDYIVAGQNGYIFPHDNAQALADILDLIAEGTLPICNPEICRSSVASFSIDNYFRTVTTYLNYLYEETKQ